MLPTTKDLVRAALRADPSLTNDARRATLAALVEAKRDEQSLILRPKQAAKLLAVTTRTLGNLTARGVLKPVRLPGNSRALGYRRIDIEALAAGTGD